MRKLEYFEKELNSSTDGKVVLKIIQQNMEEVISLVNHSRPVMVDWQRNHGPAFISSALDSGYNSGTKLKKEINGVTLQQLIRRMADVLQENGSHELSQAISRHLVMVLNFVNECNSLDELFKKIKSSEAKLIEKI